MTILGTGTKPNYSYFAYDGTGNPNQVVERLTAPSGIKIVRLGGWIGGWNDTVHTRLCVFALDGTLLGTTAEFIVANEGAAGDGNAANYEADLLVPVIIANGIDFYVGTVKDRDDAAQWMVGSTINVHYEGRGAYPSGALGDVSGPTSTARRTGMYVADYVPAAAMKVRRGAAFVDASAVQVFRGGAWSDVDSIQVRRGAAWTDAS